MFIDGVFQAHDSYSVSGTTLTFSTAPANTRVVTVYHARSSISGSNMIVDTMTGDNSDVTLTLSVAPVSENNVQVYFDGVYQSKANYSISGTTLTFSTAPATGVAVEAITHTQTTINEPAANTVTPAKIAAGDFYFDTDTLYIDATNNNVGIGTTSPEKILHIKTSVNNTAFARIESTATNSYPTLSLKNDAREYQLTTHGGVSDSFVVYDGTAGANRLVIDTSGNVGIGLTPLYSGNGTARPSLEIGGSNEGNLAFNGTGKNGLIITNSKNIGGVFKAAHTGLASAYGQTAGEHIWYTAASVSADSNQTFNERMRITSAGHVLINTATLQGAGGLSLQVGGNNVVIENNTTSSAGNGTEYQVFRRNSSQIGSITMNGTTAVQYNTSSDYRLKENVVTEWDATTRLKQLKPSRFNFITEPDRTVDGFLAHEVQDIVPEAIAGVKDEMQEEEYEVTPAVLDEDGNVVTEAVMGTREVPKYQGIDQSKLVPLLVKTIQELEERITTLENA